jgi:hypothetical protein
MMIPKPTESVKKIWPAASSQTCGSARAENTPPLPTPLGFHMNPSPLTTFWSGSWGLGVPNVSTRASTMNAATTNAGMAYVQKVSMPFDRPR